MTPAHVSEEVHVELNLSTDNALAITSARRLAGRAGFDEAGQSLIATAVSELATNIIRYGGGGEVVLRLIHEQGEVGQPGRDGVEVVAEDHGPGIRNIERAMQDHFSTGKSLGLGLPGVKRLMDEFFINSKPGVGTLCIARKWRR
ncbi:MAG: anti-sigma regulatory factor [Proteobacteria bacterium]|nr:anti-sigma regulatory factor [Pseudomonadota bacterium]